MREGGHEGPREEASSSNPRPLSHLGLAQLLFKVMDGFGVLECLHLKLIDDLALLEHLLLQSLILCSQLLLRGGQVIQLILEFLAALLQLLDCGGALLVKGQRQLVLLFHLWA